MQVIKAIQCTCFTFLAILGGSFSQVAAQVGPELHPFDRPTVDSTYIGGSLAPSRNLDPAVLSGLARNDMMSGRINKVPVSWFYRTTIAMSGAHRLHLRTAGCVGTADTGMVVTWSEGATARTAFDDNGNTGDGNGRCSFFDTGSHADSVTYTVYVFSMVRATSAASFQTSENGGASWTTQTTDKYGGALVRVGALQSGDFVQVQTPSDGGGDEATRLLLFQAPPSGSTWIGKGPVFNDSESSTDLDPKVTVDGTWASTDNVALIGKDDRSSASLRGTEIRVDIVRGPLESGSTDVPLRCAGSKCDSRNVVLPRGRYYASLFAVADEPFASGTEHSARGMGTYEKDISCPDIPRGRANDRAFTATLRKNDAVLSTRVVPRALLGEDPALGSYNRIVFEIDADGTSYYRLSVGGKASDIRFFGAWRYVRNPEANQIKIASWNFANWAFDGDTAVRTAIVQNAADLFGTRGDVNPDTQEVVERTNQAPWQWDADVVAFQEFFSSTWQAVHNRLTARSPYAWRYVNANTEIADTRVGDWVYYGPVFVNEFLTPSEGIKFSDRQMDNGASASRCNSRWEGASYDYACPLGAFTEHWHHDYYNRAVPAKLHVNRSVGRNAGTDRPVAYFNWHLYYEDGEFEQRRTNVQETINHINYLMSQPADGAFPAGACAFNKECANNPKHYANRIILAGDSNMLNHNCGEFTWTIRRLREAFGYAVDVSAAVLDSNDRTADLHYSGAPLTSASASLWGNCRPTTDPWSKMLYTDGTTDGCPYHFQDKRNWTMDPTLTSASWYPWWAATAQKIEGALDGGNRLDVFFLVGRGWAYDDPILSYRVMSHRDDANPMMGGLGGGVEMAWNPDSSCAGNVTDGNGNYAPNVSVDGCGTGEGKPAIRSDHLPIGARLRVWGR